MLSSKLSATDVCPAFDQTTSPTQQPGRLANLGMLLLSLILGDCWALIPYFFDWFGDRLRAANSRHPAANTYRTYLNDLASS